MDRTAAKALSIGTVAGAGLVGSRFGPQGPRTATWYASLRKPRYTPPGSAIAVAWGVLDVLLCVTGYRLMTKPATPSRNVALGFWTITVAGLAGFPALFFGKKSLNSSAAVAGAMCASAAATVAASARVDRTAAASMTPLVLWTAFATLLSEEIWRRN